MPVAGDSLGALTGLIALRMKTAIRYTAAAIVWCAVRYIQCVPGVSSGCENDDGDLYTKELFSIRPNSVIARNAMSHCGR